MALVHSGAKLPESIRAVGPPQVCTIAIDVDSANSIGQRRFYKTSERISSRFTCYEKMLSETDVRPSLCRFWVSPVNHFIQSGAVSSSPDPGTTYGLLRCKHCPASHPSVQKAAVVLHLVSITGARRRTRRCRLLDLASRRTAKPTAPLCL